MTEVEKILEAIRPDESFSNSINFIEDGLLDSFDLLVLVTELDKHFSISIEGTEILPENFQNLDTILKLVNKYTGKQ